MNKRGASHITSSLFMRIGEIVLPVLAFLAVIFIIVSVGSSRAPQTYFQANELANIIDSIATLDGLATINYLPIEKDFVVEMSASNIQVNIPDGKAPDAKSIHIPQSLRFDNELVNEEVAAQNGILKQIQVTRGDSSLEVYGVASEQLKSEKKQNLYECSQARIPASPVYLRIVRDPNRTAKSDTLESNFEFVNQLTKKGVVLTDNLTLATLVINVQFRQGSFNSVVLIPDTSLVSRQFACGFANEINSLQGPFVRNSGNLEKNIDPVVLVPPQRVVYSSHISKEEQGKQLLFVEVTYKQDSTSPVQEFSYYPILSHAFSSGYLQVFS